MSVHDWTSHWFNSASTSPGTTDTMTDGGGDVVEQDDSDSSVVSALDARRSGSTRSLEVARAEPPADPGDVVTATLATDLAALSRVLLDTGGAGRRARRDVVLDDSPHLTDDHDPTTPPRRGKHVGDWIDEEAPQLALPDFMRLPDGPVAADLASQPVPFELEPEPVIDVEPVRWADVLDKVPAPAPFEVEPEPSPHPVAWDAVAFRPEPASEPAVVERPAPNVALILRELAFLE